MSDVDDAPKFSPVQTWLPPWALSDCVRAVLGRSTMGMGLVGLARWCHYPAGPVFSINCLLQGSAEMLHAGVDFDPLAPRQAVPRLSVTGPYTTPIHVLNGPQAHAIMVILYPDAFWALTGIEPQSLSNQVVDARDVLPPVLLAACQRLCEGGGDDHQRVQHFFEALLPVWQQRTAEQPRHDGLHKDWAQALTPWMESLAMRAAATGWGRSLRQSERRIKQWTGWSLRKLQGSVRGEAVFFAVMDAMLEKRLDWTQIALDNGFSDQSHFIRETRRITGFSPETMRLGFNNEEGFWVYRAWAHIAGYTGPKLEVQAF
jgi:AraC-like DNA-binding protein